ncbi:MAG TPA: 23S rRNA (pseudouridine(1915)-N(3))-methyltransferase RlmH [candidate division Zixibacteria bacterium]|nr:23S rRNA (pseudouridine(1915)-N(3))-methyltransferase RlmH [candidate division Zixibacteria bacterium]
MKIRVIHVGKQKRLIADLVETYANRIANYAEFEIVSVKQARGLPEDKAIAAESENLLKKLSARDFAIALTEEGKQLGSVAFAELLSDIELSARPVAFIIGGAFGLSEEAKSRADMRLSLSKMTLQHDIALTVLLEQLYRAFTIIRGEEYHK